MKMIRWAAVAVTVLMSLMNLGVALGSGDDKASTALIVFCAGLALIGFAAAIGLAVRTSWGRPAVLFTGAVNLVGAVVALVTGGEGAAIGLVVSALILALGFFSTDTAGSPRATASPSLG